MKRALLGFAFLFVFTAESHGGVGLDGCASQFPGNAVANAPAWRSPALARRASDNIRLCYRSGDTAFFALEYSPEKLLPLWVGYRLSDTFGADRCGSFPRDYMQCYFKSDDVDSCIETGQRAKRWPGDPFHPDRELGTLQAPRLGIGDFSGTRHDRGHMAPNNAFSWHLCGTYKTFTMANMSPQFDWFNRNVWRQLEEAVLFWAVTNGPIYVVTGATFKRFPESRFATIRNGTVDKSRIVEPNETLRSDAERGDRPRIVKPTGFFKVIYKPAVGDEPARAVAFLLPHTTQKSLKFEPFVARVDLVEQASGLRFGFADSLKRGRGQRYWLDKRVPGNWSVRGSCPGGFESRGYYPRLAKDDRVALCAGDAFSPPQ